MGRVKNKQSNDHGENHQGVEHQENLICHFHIFLYLFCRLHYQSYFVNRSSQTNLLSVIEMSIGLGSGVAVDVSSQVRAASEIVKKVLVIEFRYRYIVKRLFLKSDAKV
jgi:hypothetical protein